jgi:hypothetical protein
VNAVGLNVPANTVFTGTALCGTGEKVLGGGYTQTSGPPMQVDANTPSSTGDGWTVIAERTGNGSTQFTATAICVKAS